MSVTPSYCQLVARTYRKPFHYSPISLLISVVLQLVHAIWIPYADLSQLHPPSSLSFTYTKTREKTESLNKWASFSCSHGEVYPHLSQHLTPGREGVNSKSRGQHLSHCELELTWAPIAHCGQRETFAWLVFRATDVWTEQELCFEVVCCVEAFERDSLGFLIK